LNLELIEAIALGHDLGHTPFGHDGEQALNTCCLAHDLGYFHHNIQSLRIVDSISRKGRGLNLTFQVRDGIISHDGEVHNTVLKPDRAKTEADIEEYIQKKKQGEKVEWMPATMEGCVVRISDTIAYIGQDIEDAIRLNILKRDISKLELVKMPFPRISYDEAIEILKSKGVKVEWGDDFGGEDETIISSRYDSPVIVHRYPTKSKAFYMKPDPKREDVVLGADMLAPEGYGEIIGGGQRIDDYRLLEKRI